MIQLSSCFFIRAIDFLNHDEGIKLHFYDFRILGPTALLQLAGKKEPLPSIKRPLYTQAMVGIVVAFTGFRKRDELVRTLFPVITMELKQ